MRAAAGRLQGKVGNRRNGRHTLPRAAAGVGSLITRRDGTSSRSTSKPIVGSREGCHMHRRVGRGRIRVGRILQILLKARRRRRSNGAAHSCFALISLWVFSRSSTPTAATQEIGARLYQRNRRNASKRRVLSSSSSGREVGTSCVNNVSYLCI